MTLSLKFAKRLTVFATCAAIAAIAVSGCNTVAGAGKDIKSGGGAIEKSANDSK